MIQKMGTLNDFERNYQALLELPKEVRLKIQEIINILDEAYGSDREVVGSLGGFVQVLKSNSEWNQFLEEYYIDKELYEFAEAIDSQYVYLLYVVSADYSIAIIMPKKEVDIELRYD